MDGRLLAQARTEKENIRRRSIAEDNRRHQVAYARVPALRQLDSRIAGLIGEVVSSSIGTGRPIAEIRAESLALQTERAELLVENGWPADWLDGAWDCPRCKDTGYVEGRICDCLTALYEAEQARDLSALLKLGNERFETFDLSLYDDKIITPIGLTAKQQMKKVFAFCKSYAQFFGKNSVNLLFRGGTGLGKTFLSACIAREVSQKGFSVVYETAVSALSSFEDQKFHSASVPDAESRVHRLLSCDLLILDDLGTEMITEFSRSALYTLINSRLLAGKKTIISTNLAKEKLEVLYSPQIASRLLGEYQDLPFYGSDIRLLHKAKGL